MSQSIPLPWSRSCYVCGESNEQGLRARSFRVEDRVELPFVAEEAPIYRRGQARRGPTFREATLMHAIGRVVLGRDIRATSEAFQAALAEAQASSGRRTGRRSRAG